MKKVLIINGPNLNLQGSREKEVYGEKGFEQVLKNIRPVTRENDIEVEYFQTNHEGEIIDRIHQAEGKADYIIINPGALTHYSYSIHDALKAVSVPAIEVHISNIFAREGWRAKSVISPAATGVISGFGTEVYEMAIIHIINKLKK